MASRTLYLPVMIAAAAAVACLVALLAVSEEEAQAAFPGKSGKIAFYKQTVEGPDELFVVNSDGLGQQNITNTPDVSETTPAWSPDGKKLVYQLHPPRRGADTEIAIIHVKSGSKRKITDNSYQDLHPAWSPDGTEIVFVNQSATTNDLYTMKRDGSGPRQLTDSTYNEFSPAWSPDGTKIAFSRNNSQTNHSDIWTVRAADGSNPKNLTGTDTGSDENDPDWSPDGTKIAFTLDASGKASDIYVVRSDGTGLRNVTKTPLVYEGDPAWSPNGRRIAFLRNDPQTSQNDIWTVRAADGSDPMQVTDTPSVSEFAPTWQPIP
jgi:TolB protein